MNFSVKNLLVNKNHPQVYSLSFKWVEKEEHAKLLRHFRKIYNCEKKEDYEDLLFDKTINCKDYVYNNVWFNKLFNDNLYPFSLMTRYMIEDLFRINKFKGCDFTLCYDEEFEIYTFWFEFVDNIDQAFKCNKKRKCIMATPDYDCLLVLQEKLSDLVSKPLNLSTPISVSNEIDKWLEFIFENQSIFNSIFDQGNFIKYMFFSYEKGIYIFQKEKHFVENFINFKDDLLIDKKDLPKKNELGLFHFDKNKDLFDFQIQEPDFSGVIGLSAAKKAIKERIIDPFLHKDIFEKYNKKIGGGILLYGLPGNGKTLLVRHIANELGCRVFALSASLIKDKEPGKSERILRDIFTKAKNSKKAIIFLDELDAFGAKRNGDAISLDNSITSYLLQLMDGIKVNNKDECVLVIGATNKPEVIDPALLRSGRFSEKIYVGLPSYKDRKKMLTVFLKNLNCSDDLDLDLIAKKTKDFSGADVKEFVERLKLIAIDNEIRGVKDFQINNSHAFKLLENFSSTVNKEELKKFEEKYNKGGDDYEKN